jgi:hypothetical protein
LLAAVEAVGQTPQLQELMQWPLLLVQNAEAIQLQQSQLAVLEVVEALRLEVAAESMLLLLIQLPMVLEEGGSGAVEVMAGTLAGLVLDLQFMEVSRSWMEELEDGPLVSGRLIGQPRAFSMAPSVAAVEVGTQEQVEGATVVDKGVLQELETDRVVEEVDHTTSMVY